MRLASVETRFSPDGLRSAYSERGMVASAFPDATGAGVEMLEQGGNAVDAAVATGFALCVCEPQGSGLGGQSLGLVHFEGRSVAVDGSSRVPSLTHHERLEDGDRKLGHRATTVPSTPAFYKWIHRQWGRLPWSTVLEPAARIARDGYRITELQSKLQSDRVDDFHAVSNRSGARYFLGPAGKPWAPGSLFRQPHLADVLDEIGRAGIDAFYTGEIAAQIEADMQANDGWLRADDLALVPWPIERKTLRRRYRSVLIETMPPPGAGRVLLLVMMLLNRLPSRFLRSAPIEMYHYQAETFRKAFLYRKDRPFDANTYPQEKDRILLGHRFVDALASTVRAEIDPELPQLDPAGEDLDETTHFSVMDAEGNAVAVTQSVELVYGSKAAADGLGFLYNNYLMALETKDPSHPYFLRPNAVPWSTAAPTFVHVRGRPWLALGSPGSERIFSTVSQVLMHVVDSSRSINEAVDRPRLHCSIGGRIQLEAQRFPAEVSPYLEAQGYKVVERDPFAFELGCVQATMRCLSREGFQGVADRRRDGTASGPAG